MRVTKTRIDVGPEEVNYLAVEPVEGYPNYVKSIAGSRMAAIAATLLKKEAHEARKQRFDEAHVSVLCMCCT